MKIRTTIHIPKELSNQLENASTTHGISKTTIVSTLVKHLVEENGMPIAFWTRIRYQNRREEREWKNVHIAPRGDEYEFFTDLRKVSKLSLSFLVAYAIEIYLDDLIEIINGKGDNYRYSNYSMVKMIKNDIVCWLFCWGIPPELQQIR